MGKAKQGDRVKVHYTGKLEDGTTFDSSVNRDPLEFEIGAEEVIPGFEQAVMGMTPGESKSKTIPAEQGYGLRRKEMTVEVDRGMVPANLKVRTGQQLQIEGPEGGSMPVTVIDVSDSTVTLDANHPLAGKDLSFDIELLEILSSKDASS